MMNLVSYIKIKTWCLLLPFLMLATLVSTAHATTNASFSAQASGLTSSLSISVTVNVATADVGKTGNYYLVFQYDGALSAHNGVSWVPYTGGTIPVFATAPLASVTAELVNGIDFSSVIGGQLYIGYGLTESDMIANEKYALVYTITQEVLPIGPAVVLLGTSGNFAILAKTAVSTVPSSAITGDVGVSPAATSFLTGFSLTEVGTTSATSPQVTGSLYGGDMTTPTNTNLTTAVLDMEAAYTDAAGRPTPDYLNLGGGNIGGQTLTGGLYKWGTSVTIPSDITLSGSTDDVWILQISGDLSISANKSVTLAGGAQAKNIFWQVAGEVIIQAGANFSGNILSQTAITMETGSTLNGRALAQSMVALDQATVTKPSL